MKRAPIPDCGEAGHDDGCCGNLRCLPRNPEPSGETIEQREEVCAAWCALPDDLRKDPRLARLYRALGGPRMDDPAQADPGAPPVDTVEAFSSEHLDEPFSAPLNGIAANWFHGEGAIARCSYCRRYSLDPKTLGDDRYQPVCECGKKHGWSGSFKKPGADATWSGDAPARTTPIESQPPRSNP